MVGGDTEQNQLKTEWENENYIFFLYKIKNNKKKKHKKTQYVYALIKFNIFLCSNKDYIEMWAKHTTHKTQMKSVDGVELKLRDKKKKNQ